MSVTQTEHPHIVKDSGICGGDPVIKGTRIPVWAVAGWLKGDHTLEAIHSDIYPHLSLSQLYDAASYYYDHQDDIDAQLRENNLAEAELEERRQQWERRVNTERPPSSSS